MGFGRKKEKHTAPGIRWWSPTQLLVWRLPVYLWESGRDPEFSSTYGRMWKVVVMKGVMYQGRGVLSGWVGNTFV